MSRQFTHRGIRRCAVYSLGTGCPVDIMSPSIELSRDLLDRIDSYREDDESYEEFIEELLNIYETQGAFLQEGYSE